jgi:hypothetical protein
MGTLMFGNQEQLDCIQPVALKGAEGEALCLAYKDTITFIGAGAWIKDDGYVLKVEGKDSFYPLPQGAKLKTFQTSGMLPDPLPPYSIPLWKYGLGYSLWLCIVLIVAGVVWSSARKKKRQREDLEAPLSVGPPLLQTPHDRFFGETLRPMLHPNEQVDQQAYGFTEPMLVNGDLTPGKKAAWCALTDQRLFLIHAKAGTFGPLQESLGVDEYPRSSIVAAVSDDGLIRIQLADGRVLLLWVRRKERGLTNQVRFIRDLPKLFSAPQLVAQPAATAAG